MSQEMADTRLTYAAKNLIQYPSLFPIFSLKRTQTSLLKNACLLQNMVRNFEVFTVDRRNNCNYLLYFFSIDRSPLLLCRKTTINDIRHMRISVRSDDSVSNAPQCISARNLQIFRGKRFEYAGKACNVYKGIWKPNKSTTMDVAIKFLKTQTDEKRMKVSLDGSAMAIANNVCSQVEMDKCVHRILLLSRSFWKWLINVYFGNVILL